uniref:Uncharacterized protein n=1 Tax=Sphaerodactylus townsendi TaxID=933632 RepID=A0ACB8FYF0_9SAUR
MAGAPGSALWAPVTFEEVAIYFSPKEWGELANWQKQLYKDVMQDNYETLLSLGLAASKPDIIQRIEQGGEPCVGRLQDLKAHESPSQDLSSGTQVLVKEDSCLQENLKRVLWHQVHPEASVGSVNNELPTWLSHSAITGVAALPPWHTELTWPNGPVAGKQPTPLEFDAGHSGVAVDAFWPVPMAVPQASTHEEMLLICTQCQKCFPARSAQSVPAVVPTDVGSNSKHCKEGEIEPVEGALD